MDATNQGVPSAGGQLAGDVHRNAAIKRLRKLQAQEAQGKAPSAPQAPSGGPPAPRGY